MRRATGLLLAAWLCAGAPAPLAGQDAELPRAVAERIIALYNRPETIRFTGASRVGAGSEIVGDVAVLEGPLVVGGRIRGDVVVLNGHARLEPGAEITGALTVVGGAATGLDRARLGGPLSVYPEPLRVHAEHDRLVLAAREPRPALSAGRAFPFGRVDLSMAVRRSYNRVEGLPVAAGPRLRFGASNPTRLDALVIYRSAYGLRFDADQLGYAISLEQSVGGHDAVRVGASLRSLIDPIESWGISDRENSLATFVLHRDYRDHYRREGWGAHVRLVPPGRGWNASLEFRDEQHAALTTEGPWALFDNDEAWRPQPLVAEGRLRSLALGLGVDTRNDRATPSTGWHVRTELERGLGGTLVERVVPDAGAFRLGTRAAEDEFGAALVDARRYARLGPDSRMALRLLAAGSIDGGPLPPQRQHALGGEGSLPAYDPFVSDCGARERAVEIGKDRLFPYYGCDRLVLLQLEYRSTFPFLRRLVGETGFDLGLTPEWVVFFDTGRAWNEDEARRGRGGGQDDFAADAGLGVRVGPLGIYWARSLSGRGQGTNSFLRLGARL